MSEPASSAPPADWRRFHWRLGPGATALALMAATLAIALLTIGFDSFWFDESVTLRVSRFGTRQFIETITTREPFWALYYLFMRGWVMLGDSAIFLRLPSALAASAAVGLTYLVGRQLIGPRAALIGGLVLVPHAFLLQYAQEARGYAFAIALVVAATWAFLRASERPTWSRWLAYALLATLAVYAHFFAAFVLLAHAVAIALHDGNWVRENRRFLIAAALYVAAATLPLAIWLAAAEQTRNFVRAITPERLISAFAWFGGANVMIDGVTHYVLATVAALAVGAGVVLLVRSASPGPHRWRPLFLVGWLLLPLVLSVVISLTIKPVYVYRYLIVSLPAFALTVGFLLSRIQRPPLRLLAATAAAVALATGAWSVLIEPHKPDWNGVARFMLSSACPGDVLITQPSWQWTPINYALEQATEGEVPERRETRLRPHHAEAALDRLRREERRIWLVIFDHRLVPNAESYPFLALMEDGRTLRTEELFRGARVRLYEPAWFDPAGIGCDVAEESDRG